MKNRLLGLALLLLLPGSIARAAQFPVIILSPHDMQRVPYRPCLVGVGPHGGQDLWVILHPTIWSDYYVEPAVSWVQEDHFRVTLYVGERGQNSSAGQIFELQVFKGNAYHEGMKLGAFPSAGAVSPVIRLVRDDRASDNCDVAAARSAAPAVAGLTTSVSLPAPSSPPATAAPVQASSAQTTAEPAAVSPFATGLRRYAHMVAFSFCAFALLMLIVLVRLNERAARAALWLSKWIAVFLSWLWCFAEKVVDSVTGLGAWLGPQARRAVVTLAKGRGYRGDLRSWGLSVLAFPVLCAATVMLYYGESKMIQISLGLIFSTEVSASSSPNGPSIFDSPGAAPASDNNRVEPSQSRHLAFSYRVRGIFDRTFDSFEKLWDEPMGFMALGLGALQGAFGIVLLWGLRAAEAVRLHPAEFFRERPLLCACFVVLNLALAAMAAMRGYELSPTGANPWAPSAIAGLLAISLPLIMSACAHCALECAADQLTMIKLAVLVSGVCPARS